jgi:predicted hydrolase (HD superfamily)
MPNDVRLDFPSIFRDFHKNLIANFGRTGKMNYQEALQLMHEYTKSDALRKHMYAVEAAMRAYARKQGEDEEKWAMVGILHDFDYEMFPSAPDHPAKGSEILKEKGCPEEIRRAILGHASYMNVPRDTKMAQVLYACDELCGFINACAIIRPKKIADLEVSSVKKKLKDKAFARNVSREDILQGTQELGVPLDEHIQFVISAMKGDAQRLGL